METTLSVGVLTGAGDAQGQGFMVMLCPSNREESFQGLKYAGHVVRACH